MGRLLGRMTACVFFLIIACASSYAFETDQFTNRLHPIVDSKEVINRRINALVMSVVISWPAKAGADEARFAEKVRQAIIPRTLIDGLEFWAELTPPN